MSRIQGDCKEYELRHRELDGILYRMCRKHPGHADIGGVHAKLWIIGRTYATGIERKIESEGTQGSSMSQLAELMHRRHRSVDKWIRRLHGFREPLRVRMLPDIFLAHGKLTLLIQGLLRREACPRSFVSKYLHFHCRVVPIYDSLAASSLRARVRWNDDLELCGVPAGADSVYVRHVFRFMRLYGDLRQERPGTTVKQADRHLLEEYRRGKA